MSLCESGLSDSYQNSSSGNKNKNKKQNKLRFVDIDIEIETQNMLIPSETQEIKQTVILTGICITFKAPCHRGKWQKLT